MRLAGIWLDPAGIWLCRRRTRMTGDGMGEDRGTSTQGIVARMLVCLALIAIPPAGALAQDAAAEAAQTAEAEPDAGPAPDAAPDAAPADATADDVAEAALLSEDELDDLVSPIALYPDALLAQVFVASTYPLDVVKADQWVDANADMPEADRVDATEAEGWDPSVAVLAAGFPTVIGGMAGDIDNTELLGDAILTQSDDVLEAVQRMRARADAVGNLPSNEAQTVTVEGDNISIAPTTPEVVYVPTYDSQAVYTTTATSVPTVVDSTSPGFSTGSLVATGLLSFGAGMLVNEIFDNNDNWHGYWGPSYGPIGWGGGNFRPYPPGWGGGNNNINVDFDREINIDNNGNWRPDRDRQDRARDKIADRRGVSTLPANRPGRDDGGRAALKQKLDAKGGGARGRENLLANRDSIRSGLGAASGGGKLADRAGGGGKLANRAGGGKLADRKPGAKQTAFGKGNKNLTGAKRAAKRGKASTARAGTARTGAGGGKGARAGGGGRKIANKGGGGHKAARKGAGNRSAFSKGGGGKRAQAGKSRGAKSRGGGRGGGGGSGGADAVRSPVPAATAAAGPGGALPATRRQWDTEPPLVPARLPGALGRARGHGMEIHDDEDRVSPACSRSGLARRRRSPRPRRFDEPEAAVRPWSMRSRRMTVKRSSRSSGRRTRTSSSRATTSATARTGTISWPPITR